MMELMTHTPVMMEQMMERMMHTPVMMEQMMERMMHTPVMMEQMMERMMHTLVMMERMMERMMLKLLFLMMNLLLSVIECQYWSLQLLHWSYSYNLYVIEMVILYSHFHVCFAFSCFESLVPILN